MFYNFPAKKIRCLRRYPFRTLTAYVSIFTRFLFHQSRRTRYALLFAPLVCGLVKGVRFAD